jgi:Fe-S oxidoreductase
MRRAPEAAEYLRANLLRHGNPFGTLGRGRTKWAENLSLPERGKRIFFDGCMDSLMGYGETLMAAETRFQKIGIDMERLISLGRKLKLDKIIKKFGSKNEEYEMRLRRTVEVLRKLGIKVAHLKEGPCCGKPFHTYGFLKEFSAQVKKIQEWFEEAGVREIITPNPVCLYTFVNLIPRWEPKFDVRVKHVSQAVLERLRESRVDLRLGEPVKVVYHDPCYLARFLGITEEPREILSRIKGVTLVEAENNRLNTKCDGGGGIEIIYPELARGMAKGRVKELLATGADIIATSCAPCMMMLRIGVEEFNAGVEVLDIMDLVHKSLE